jgi:ribosomal protein L29
MAKLDYSKLSVEDLENRRKEMDEELTSAKIKFRVGQFKRTSEFSRLRKEVARINTFIRQRKIAEAGAKN